MENMKKQVIDLLCDKLGCDEGFINEETQIVNDLGADSLDMVEIIIDMERKFEITLSDEDFNEIVTVGDLIKKIEDKLKENK